MNFNIQQRIPNLIKEILRSEELTTRQVYERLMDAVARGKKGKTSPWRNTPSMAQLGSLLGSSLHPFRRVTPKGKYPAIWTYDGEEEE